MDDFYETEKNQDAGAAAPPQRTQGTVPELEALDRAQPSVPCNIGLPKIDPSPAAVAALIYRVTTSIHPTTGGLTLK